MQTFFLAFMENLAGRFECLPLSDEGNQISGCYFGLCVCNDHPGLPLYGGKPGACGEGELAQLLTDCARSPCHRKTLHEQFPPTELFQGNRSGVS